MKLQYWVTIAVASALWGPACVSAQTIQGIHGIPGIQGLQGLQRMQGRPHLPMPHSPVNRPGSAGNFFLHSSPTFPNRRVPSLEPPESGDIHPVTPDMAWPKSHSLITPGRPSMKSGPGNILNGEDLSGRGDLGIEEPLGGIGGADGLLGR